jgi:hypothetical protein
VRLPHGRRDGFAPIAVEVAEPTVAVAIGVLGQYSSHNNSSVTARRFSSLWTWDQSGSGRAGFSSNVGEVNSRRSNSVSSSPSGIGQVTPMTAARRRSSATVDRLIPIVTAICRSLTPRACLNLRTSRTFRIGALLAGIGPPLAWPQRASRPRFDRRQRELQAALTKVAGFNRNGWPTSVGIGGRITSESLAALRRITQADATSDGDCACSASPKPSYFARRNVPIPAALFPVGVDTSSYSTAEQPGSLCARDMG